MNRAGVGIVAAALVAVAAAVVGSCSDDGHVVVCGDGRSEHARGEKAASRLSSRLFTSIPDPDSTGPKKIVLDRKYMDAWVEENPAVVPALEEVPF